MGKYRELYARITTLTWDETPIERIEGRVSGGSINIDGTSCMRRTCSLTLQVGPNEQIGDYHWTLNTKFMLEIGVKEEVQDVITWTKQGIFIFTSFNTSVNTNSYTVSIQGKDKMCLLNGDIGGNLNASVDFGVEEFVDVEAELIQRDKVPIYEIIQNILTMWGQELPHNVFVNDLEPFGFELLEYKGDVPLYIIYSGSREVVQITFDPTARWISEDGMSGQSLDDPQLQYYRTAFDQATKVQFGSSWNPDDMYYLIGKCETNDEAGYRLCKLVYAGDLIANINETITSVLDKICQMLGEYEYFYNVDGQFVFQKKPAYAPIYQSSLKSQYIRPTAFQDYISYFFNGLEEITQISNNPTLKSLRNDYTIWGSRTATSGIELPIQYRYAIDKRPEEYTTFAHVGKDSGITYYQHTYKTNPGADDTEARAQYKVIADTRNAALQAANELTDADERIKARRKAKQDFEDALEDSTIVEEIAWDYRELIYQMAQDFFDCNQDDNYNIHTGYEIYYTDMLSKWRDIYDLSYAGQTNENDITYADDGFVETLKEAPWLLTFYFELSGEGTEMDQYSVSAIGDRPKVVNETTLNAIIYPDIPSEVFYTKLDNNLLDLTSAYTKIHLTESVANLFVISARGQSAMEKMQDLIYNGTYCAETINISAVPNYSLQPNTRISVVDNSTHIDGEYIITRITLPLDYKGLMSITGTKATQEII